MLIGILLIFLKENQSLVTYSIECLTAMMIKISFKNKQKNPNNLNCLGQFFSEKLQLYFYLGHYPFSLFGAVKTVKLLICV